MKFLSALTALTLTASGLIAEEVNVYSYRQPELIEPLTTAFTEKTGIKVNVAFLKKGMIERLRSEGARSPADVVLTVDISRLAAVVDAGLTQPISSETLDANVPSDLRDPDGHWFGLTTRARIIYASKERVADGEVTTYEDLADPKWKGRICTRSGTHAYNVALTSAVLQKYGTEGTIKWLEGVKANLARKPQGNDRAQVKAIWAGECDISVGNTYYMGAMVKDEEQKPWAEAVRIVFPTFKGGGTHVNVAGVALTKSAPNRDAAMTFIDFLASTEGQEIYAEINNEYPIADGTSASDLVQSWGSFTPDSVNLMELAGLRGEALKLIETVNFDE